MIGICNTDGKGYWSNVKKAVTIVDLVVTTGYDNAGNRLPLLEAEYGELCAYFSPTAWDVKKDGLIYTDKQWMIDFKNMLSAARFSSLAIEGVSYSEQGMQGHNYVSMDVDENFLKECDVLLNFATGKPKTIKIRVDIS